MSVPAQNTTYTPDDLLNMPDGGSFELVNGQLLEKQMGYKSSRIGTILLEYLAPYCRERNLGWLNGPEAGFQCFPDEPNRVRKPDVSFIQAGRLSAKDEPEGHCRIPPDLAAEVVSPNDLFEEVSVKVNEYLAAGVQLVWIVDPKAERVFIYRQNDTAAVLTNKDELDGEDVIPGFRCPVADLFKPPVDTS
jgi:Uma2 family endonuclease